MIQTRYLKVFFLFVKFICNYLEKKKNPYTYILPIKFGHLYFDIELFFLQRSIQSNNGHDHRALLRYIEAKYFPPIFYFVYLYKGHGIPLKRGSRIFPK